MQSSESRHFQLSSGQFHAGRNVARFPASLQFVNQAKRFRAMPRVAVRRRQQLDGARIAVRHYGSRFFEHRNRLFVLAFTDQCKSRFCQKQRTPKTHVFGTVMIFDQKKEPEILW